MLVQEQQPNLMQRLCVILEQMESLYMRVLPLLDLERKSLIEMDFDGLYEGMREKDELLATIRKLDKERLKIQDHFAMINELAPEAISLKSFAEMLLDGSEEDTRLGLRMLTVRDRIHSLIEETKLCVKKNERFIERSVNNLRGLAQAVTDSLDTGKERESARKPQHSTYGKNAKVKSKEQRPGSIVSGQV